MGGEVLSPAKAGPPPSIGECQGRDSRRGWLGKKGGWDRGLMDKKPRKGRTFEM